MAKPSRKPPKTRIKKLFVLDTNVLMHDPASLFRFEEHDLYLPMGTLEELDGNKKGLHYLVYFKMDGSKVDEFTRLCHLNELVIRHLLLSHSPKLFDIMSHSLAQHTSGGAQQEAAPAPAAAAPAPAAAV